MHIIPAIDIIDGKCVRLTKGDYSTKKEYSAGPIDVAKSFEDVGIQFLHLVDLDGAKQRKVVNLNVLEAICKETKLKVDFGGGVQSDDDIEKVFYAGASQITAGSVAVRNPELLESWLEKYGTEKIILGADVKNGLVAISGWEEDSKIQLEDFLNEKTRLGLNYVISTDVKVDGTLSGPSTNLYKWMKSKFPNLNIIASGGVSSIDDLKELENVGVYGAIVGKAIYENKINLSDLKTF
ncbi:MAG: 1-(5-phosphoribosyl)-5-[(5-phosphoribosylamino)methylideneamino]imidazole-4-carboxamide isomerase [Cyclobacteriaceae bacterium]